jgi:hypothetical protein
VAIVLQTLHTTFQDRIVAIAYEPFAKQIYFSLQERIFAISISAEKFYRGQKFSWHY